MQTARIVLVAALMVGGLDVAANAKMNVVVIHNDDNSSREFKLRVIPAPSSTDAATDAEFSILSGTRDGNGGNLDKLQDGKAPTESDQPRENFFFNYSGGGGRLLVDLKNLTLIEQVNTYSWHPNTRGPQVYELYASDGKGDGFNARPADGTDLETSGWKLLAKVDTRPGDDGGEEGGQYGVSIFDSEGPIGPFRYVLFNVSRTESRDIFGNTFYSEIDVVASDAPAKGEADKAAPYVVIMETDDGSFHATIDTSDTPDLTEWANNQLAPVVKEWYPKIVKMLASEGYEAPRSFSIRFSPEYRGVAATGGTHVYCAAEWFHRNLEGEAKGAVVHELVHVVQQYGRARRNNPNATRPPGWLVEGIADYIRWFLYEPQSRGAEIDGRNIERARYNASYRISANFLNWVTENHDRHVVAKLNAALREGSYDDDLWADYTNRTLVELDNDWKASLARKPASDAAAKSATRSVAGSASENGVANDLTDEEKAAGWKLLFDGKGFAGWHNFGSESVRPGWKVENGVLKCADPSDAGDLCTDDQFDWFELQLEYNITEGGNSGIMFRVSDEGRVAWASGPEVQLLDNAKGADPQRSGWLYALYQPETDPDTGKPMDATKSAGEWNHLSLLVTPEKCAHTMNGVKYFEYVLGSDDFNERVANSKFRRMRRFAKAEQGYIALQGDHGQISFRNIKIRPIKAESDEQNIGQ